MDSYVCDRRMNPQCPGSLFLHIPRDGRSAISTIKGVGYDLPPIATTQAAASGPGRLANESHPMTGLLGPRQDSGGEEMIMNTVDVSDPSSYQG